MINLDRFTLPFSRATAEANILEVLRDGEMFRYRADGGRSWNTRMESQLAAWIDPGLSGLSANSGTAALIAALRAVGVRPGDYVAIPAFTFIATAMAVVQLGATPVPIDLDDGLGLDLRSLGHALENDVSAVVCVYVQGHAADFDGVKNILDERQIPLLEDACQGLGASCYGRKAGSLGALGIYSFQQSKQVAAGEGGFIVGRDSVLLDRCSRLIDLGAVRTEQGTPDWDHANAAFGTNLRMSELQAAVVMAQLGVLEEVIRRQRSVRANLRALLEAAGVPTWLSADPQGDTGSHLLVLADSERSALAIARECQERQVLVRRVWDRAYYEYSLFERARLTPKLLAVRAAPRAEDVARRLLTLPTPATLSEADLSTMTDVIAAAASARRVGVSSK